MLFKDMMDFGDGDALMIYPGSVTKGSDAKMILDCVFRPMTFRWGVGWQSEGLVVDIQAIFLV